jgi:hypothetical protein
MAQVSLVETILQEKRSRFGYWHDILAPNRRGVTTIPIGINEAAPN